MQNISNDEVMMIATFVPHPYLINLFLVNNIWRNSIDNESFYEAVTKHKY
jgi:hypothetical protein